MPRIARMVVRGEKSVYHVMSRTALDGFPFGAAEKDEFVKIIQKFSKLYFVEVLGFCIMGNHFHLVVQMNTDSNYTDEDIQKRFVSFYGDEQLFIKENIPNFRKKWANLSEYIKNIKHAFSWYYNKRHNRRGTLWGERFKSVIVQRGETLINCLAYIDLNPLRAGIVERPEAYRWNSLGYHVQTGNKEKFLSLDLGLKEFGVKTDKERLRRYRRYVYEAGAVNRPEKGRIKVIDKTVVEKERKKNFELSRIQRFQYRTRYFSDSGIIGTKEFVNANYQLFKDLFQSKNKKIPKPIKGLDGVYSLKRLSEAI
jgi:REP-associated tyrosine transposase